jgi:hypothetical protein
VVVNRILFGKLRTKVHTGNVGNDRMFHCSGHLDGRSLVDVCKDRKEEDQSRNRDLQWRCWRRGSQCGREWYREGLKVDRISRLIQQVLSPSELRRYQGLSATILGFQSILCIFIVLNALTSTARELRSQTYDKFVRRLSFLFFLRPRLMCKISI